MKSKDKNKKENNQCKKNIKNVQYNTPNYFGNRGYIFDKEKYYAQKQEYLNQKINNEKYGEKNFTDIWGHIPNNHKNQWFLPSVAEWSAIIDSLNILPGNIFQKGFFTEGYWTSSQFNPYCFYYIDLKNNEIGYERLGLMSAVRLATTI